MANNNIPYPLRYWQCCYESQSINGNMVSFLVHAIEIDTLSKVSSLWEKCIQGSRILGSSPKLNFVSLEGSNLVELNPLITPTFSHMSPVGLGLPPDTLTFAVEYNLPMECCCDKGTR